MEVTWLYFPVADTYEVSTMRLSYATVVRLLYRRLSSLSFSHHTSHMILIFELSRYTVLSLDCILSLVMALIIIILTYYPTNDRDDVLINVSMSYDPLSRQEKLSSDPIYPVSIDVLSLFYCVTDT